MSLFLDACLVAVGGALGAPARYAVDVVVQSRRPSSFPLGTFIVNVAGSLVLGIVAALTGVLATPSWLLPLVGAGFCGALTTFSTFSLEVVRLVEEDRPGTAAAYLLGSLLTAYAACALGWHTTAQLFGL